MTEIGVSPWQQLFERLVGGSTSLPVLTGKPKQTGSIQGFIVIWGVLRPSTNNCFAACHCVLATLTSSLNPVRFLRSTFAARPC